MGNITNLLISLSFKQGQIDEWCIIKNSSKQWPEANNSLVYVINVSFKPRRVDTFLFIGLTTLGTSVNYD